MEIWKFKYSNIKYSKIITRSLRFKSSMSYVRLYIIIMGISSNLPEYNYRLIPLENLNGVIS